MIQCMCFLYEESYEKFTANTRASEFLLHWLAIWVVPLIPFSYWYIHLLQLTTADHSPNWTPLGSHCTHKPAYARWHVKRKREHTKIKAFA